MDLRLFSLRKNRDCTNSVVKKAPISLAVTAQLMCLFHIHKILFFSTPEPNAHG